MGFKSLTLQMIPWCFHVGDATCDPRTPPPFRTVRLIRSDGQVKVYHRPVNASELMKQYPRHLICHSDSFFIGQKVPALSGTDSLRPGNSYFLLPTHFFHSVLSFVTVASSFAQPKNSSKGASLRHFDIQKTASGTLQIRVSVESVEEREGSRVCTTEELEKDYNKLVRCEARRWKPKLETIRERRRRIGIVGGGESVFGGFKRRKKKNSE